MKRKNFKLMLSVFLLLIFLTVFSFSSFTGFFIIPSVGEENATKIIVVLTPNESQSDNKNIEKGLRLAIENFKSPNGNNFTLIFEQEQPDLNITRDNVEKLINDGGKIVMPLSFKAFMTLAPLAEEKKVISFSPTICYPLLDYNYSYVFISRDCIVSPSLIMAHVIREKFNISNINIIYSNETWGMHMKDQFKNMFEELGGSVASEISFDMSSIDINQLNRDLNETSFKSFFLANRPSTYDHDVFPIILTLDNLNSTVFTRISQEEGRFLLSQSSKNIIFISDNYEPRSSYDLDLEYKPEYIRDPNVFLKEAYDTIKIFSTVMQICGEDTECIQKELHTNEFDGTFGKIRFGENGVIIRPYMIKTVENGKIINLFEYSLLENL